MHKTLTTFYWNADWNKVLERTNNARLLKLWWNKNNKSVVCLPSIHAVLICCCLQGSCKWGSASPRFPLLIGKAHVLYETSLVKVDSIQSDAIYIHFHNWNSRKILLWVRHFHFFFFFIHIWHWVAQKVLSYFNTFR